MRCRFGLLNTLLLDLEWLTYTILVYLIIIIAKGDTRPKPKCPKKATRTDTEGPLFVANAPKRADIYNALAPAEELKDPEKLVLLRGKIFDSNCRGVRGATVHVWYAGGTSEKGDYFTSNTEYRIIAKLAGEY